MTPRYIKDAVNSAIHTSDIDGNQRPISLAHYAVGVALKAFAERHPRAQVMLETDCEIESVPA